MATNSFSLYRIFYGDNIVYIGRTKQPLATRIRSHLFAKPMHRTISIDRVSKIEYASLPTAADMNLYEIYYILKEKPPLNVDDKEKDNLTVTLPELEWQLFETPLWAKWEKELAEKENDYERMLRRYRLIPEEIHVLRSSFRAGDLTKEEFAVKIDALKEESVNLRKTLWA